MLLTETSQAGGMGGACGTYGKEVNTGFWWVNHKGKRALGNPKCGWEDNINMELQGIEIEGMGAD